MYSPVMLGLKRGLSLRCPECGQGRLLRGYLTVQADCAICGHDNAQYPSDDAPPYFTILIIGHLGMGPVLVFPFVWTWPVQWVLLTTIPALAAMTLLILPRVKGAVIGVQWAIKKGSGQAPGQDDDQSWRAES